MKEKGVFTLGTRSMVRRLATSEKEEMLDEELSERAVGASN